MERSQPTVKERFSQHLRASQEEEQETMALIAYLQERDRAEKLQSTLHAPKIQEQLPRTASSKKQAQKPIRERSSNSNSFSKYLRIKQEKNKPSAGDCGICLSQLSNTPARLECNHVFCFECLQKWLDQCSKCPFCRKDCSWMLVNGKHTDIEQRHQMEEEEEDLLCYVCMRDENDEQLLICDACDFYLCHVYCDRDLRKMPARHELWYCHFCTERPYQTTSHSRSNGYALDGFVVADEISESSDEQVSYYSSDRRFH